MGGFWSANRYHGLGFNATTDDNFQGAWNANHYASGTVVAEGDYNWEIYKSRKELNQSAESRPGASMLAALAL
eukprot:NODE_3814_length_402_cov_108.736544_g3376_i0.p2 GENE.NODE_3814_length_402_cov_108.736544_g3376_i0~~NODE_3814_length_402_cov_108.736544_g3376_i0.p2  ORF type:complete len:81 (-),score=27.39 NODE_3814_length_402_cov_108.736544_g3376_i0:158-376(-)